MATEQQYYELLVRTDHPVFEKDFSPSQDGTSPFNSIMNRVMAKQMVRWRASLDSLIGNSFPNTVDETSIDDWELTFFGYTKDSELIAQRVIELLAKINSTPGLSVNDVIALAQAITGRTPTVLRSLWGEGWIIGQGVIGISTILSGTQAVDSQIYVVIFAAQLATDVRSNFDKALSAIEKGGSIHVIEAPTVQWIIGQSAIGIDTIL